VHAAVVHYEYLHCDAAAAMHVFLLCVMMWKLFIRICRGFW